MTSRIKKMFLYDKVLHYPGSALIDPGYIPRAVDSMGVPDGSTVLSWRSDRENRRFVVFVGNPAFDPVDISSDSHPIHLPVLIPDRVGDHTPYQPGDPGFPADARDAESTICIACGLKDAELGNPCNRNRVISRFLAVAERLNEWYGDMAMSQTIWSDDANKLVLQGDSLDRLTSILKSNYEAIGFHTRTTPDRPK